MGNRHRLSRPHVVTFEQYRYLMDGSLKQSKRKLAFAVIGIVLASCGGGGGGGPSVGDGSGSGGSGSSGGSGGTGFDPTSPESVTYSIDYHPAFNVSLPYPEGWFRTLGADKVLPGLVVEIEEPADIGVFAATIRVTRVAAGEPTLPSRVTITEVLETNTFSVGGHSATETVFDGDEIGIDELLRFIETTIDYDGYRYSILATMERERQYPNYSDLMRYITQRVELGSDVLEVERLFEPGPAAIASSGTEFLAIACHPTTRQFFYGGSLIAQRLDSRGQRVGDSILIDNQQIPCSEARPAAAWDGTNYLVTYVREMDIVASVDGQLVATTQDSVVGKRIGSNGDLIDTSPILISWEALVQESNILVNKPASTPDIAFDGSRYVVVWDQVMNTNVTDIKNVRQIHGRFVAPDGTVSDPFIVTNELIGLYGTSSYFHWQGDIAIGADRIMVTFGPRGEPQPLSRPSPIYAQFFDFLGNALMPQPVVIREDPGTLNPRYAQVAYNGTDFVAAWIEGEQRETLISGGLYGIHARLVSPDGTLLNGGPETAGAILVPQDGTDREYLELSYLNGEFLAVWAVIGFSNEDGNWGVRFSPDLSSVGSSMPINATRGDVVGYGFGESLQPVFAKTDQAGLVVWTSENFVKTWPMRPELAGSP